jgi:hypothetical protein
VTEAEQDPFRDGGVHQTHARINPWVLPPCPA